MRPATSPDRTWVSVPNPLPALMYAASDIAVVDGPHGSHLLLGQGRQRARAAIVLNLARIFPAGNDGRDALEHEDPTKGRLGQRGASGQQRLQLFNGFQPDFVRNARKRLAHIEGFAVTVEIAVIVTLER